MCLAIKTQKNNWPNKSIYYKVYDLQSSVTLAVSPLFYGKSFKLRYDTMLISNRKSQFITKQETIEGSISKGIHVCLSLAEAKKYALEASNRIIVGVEGSPDDFVAVGNDNKQAVFTKVKLENIIGVSTLVYKDGIGHHRKIRKPTAKEVDKFFSGIEINV